MASIIKKHPYITATITAVLLAIVVWLCVPKEYTAITKLSDEYKEVDIVIGLDKYQARIREISESANNGINNMEVYCKVLKSEDFARFLSHKIIPGKNITYGEYLEEEDTIDALLDNINYNYSNEQGTLTIAFSDKEAIVASQMLDYATEELQNIITSHRREVAEHLLISIDSLRKEASIKYNKAQEKYTSYIDTHFNLNTEKEIQEKDYLEKEAKQTYESYEKVCTQYARQLALTKRSYSSFAIIQANTVPTSTSNSFFPYLLSFWMIIMAITKGSLLFFERKKENCKIEFGDIFAPWAITIEVWGGLLILFLMYSDILDPLTEQFYISISLWLPTFVITSFVTFNLLEHKVQTLPRNGIDINTHFFYFLFILALFLSPMYFYRVWEILSSFDPDDMMKNARILAVFGEGLGFLNYSSVVAQSLLLVSLWRYPQIPKWQLCAIILCCIINSIAIMEKGGIFLVILCSIYVLFKRGVIKGRHLLFTGVAAILLFYYFNLMREGEDSDYAKNESLLDFVGMYIMSPPVAYCKTMRDVDILFGANIFGELYARLNNWGFGNYEIHPKLQEFVYIPVPTNVYTIMQPFFRDFGYKGVCFFAGVYGVISGALYRFSCNGNAVCICLYTYMVEVLVLQFFQENIFLSITFVMELFFLVWLMTQKKVILSYGYRGT